MIESLPTKEITISGTERHFENGVLSRHDGPAVIHVGGDEEWYANGIRHRFDIDTPNILYPAVSRWSLMEFEYWIKGIFICRNPYFGQYIIEWEGWYRVHGDTSLTQSKFELFVPAPKYKNLYPRKARNTLVTEEQYRGTYGTSYGRVTRAPDDDSAYP